MNFDFSHLYKTETLTVEAGAHTFDVTVREIPHGDYVALQKEMMPEISLSNDKRAMERQLANVKLSAPEFADRQAMLAISAWTLKTASGDDVPVTLEAWRALPHHITENIEKAIERLNPDLDSEFQGEPANGSGS